MRKASQPEKLKIIKNMYESGKSIQEIASFLGYKTETVNQLLSKTGINRSHRISNYSAKIIEMRKNGARVEDIAKEIGFNRASVCKFLRKAGYGKYRIVEVNKLEEEALINENTVYAKDKQIIFRKIVIDGKRYIDVTEAFI